MTFEPIAPVGGAIFFLIVALAFIVTTTIISKVKLRSAIRRGLIAVALFGVAIGAILVALVSPLVASSPDGSAPVPSVEIHIPWVQILLLIGGLVVVIGGVVLALSRGRSIAQPAELLRWGGE